MIASHFTAITIILLQCFGLWVQLKILRRIEDQGDVIKELCISLMRQDKEFRDAGILPQIGSFKKTK